MGIFERFLSLWVARLIAAGARCMLSCNGLWSIVFMAGLDQENASIQDQSCQILI